MNISSMKIAFVGNSNNMPYIYAKEMKRRGLDVTLFLDRPKSYLLDRPESNDPELQSGLPSWIVELEWIFPSRYISSSIPAVFYRGLINELKKYDVVFFNGNLISLGQFIEEGKIVVNIFSGADLDIAADYGCRELVVSNIYRLTFRKLVPKFFIEWLFPLFISNQRKGIRRADLVNYYPTGIVPNGDKLLREIMAGKTYTRLELRGAECSRFDYQEIEKTKEVFTILSFIRFYYLTTSIDNKRNDTMLKGIALFLSRTKLTKPVEIILFEKGNDLAEAKILCDELGLTNYIKWIKIVSLHELIDYIKISNVVFDQLGNQLIGGGLHSMLAGRPLIANARPDIFKPITKVDSPVCHAVNQEDVAYWLEKIYNDQDFGIDLGKRCREYVLKFHNSNSTVDYFTNYIQNNLKILNR